jgi:hypothetical protein
MASFFRTLWDYKALYPNLKHPSTNKEEINNAKEKDPVIK